VLFVFPFLESGRAGLCHFLGPADLATEAGPLVDFASPPRRQCFLLFSCLFHLLLFLNEGLRSPYVTPLPAPPSPPSDASRWLASCCPLFFESWSSFLRCFVLPPVFGPLDCPVFFFFFFFFFFACPFPVPRPEPLFFGETS